jgi:MATE family multidrug resistance protein
MIVRKPVTNSTRSKFLTLTALNILSNITIPLTGLADTAVLGNTNNTLAIAGVSLGTVLFDYLYWGFGFLRMGTTGTTAIKTGQGDEKAAYLVLGRSLLIGLLIGSFIWILSPIIGEYGFRVLSGGEELKEIGKTYFYHRIWDAPFTMMNLVWVGWFLGRSRSGIVLFLTLTANSVNIVLDIYFVFTLNMGADGVGLATGISQCVQFILSFIILIFLKKDFPLSSFIQDFFHKNEIFHLLSFNREVFFRTVFLIITFSTFRNFSAGMGNEVLTVNTLLLQFMLVYAFFVDGSAFATETLAGELYGKGEKNLLNQILQYSFAFGIAIALGFTIILGFFSGDILSLLAKDKNILNLGSEYVPWLFPVLFLGSIAFAYDGLFLGLVMGRTLRNSMLVSTIFFYLPIATLAYFIQSNELLWTSLAIYMGARAITLHFAKRQLHL